MQDDGVVLLTCSRQESRYVNEADDRNVEGIAEAYEAGTLARGVHIEHTCIARRLIGDDTYALSVEAGKADDNILGEFRLYLEELSVIGDSGDNLIHIVGLVGVLWDNLVQRVLHAVDGIGALLAGSQFHVV